MVLFCHQWKWKGSKYFCKQFQRGSLSLDLWCDFEEIDFKKIEFRQFCKFEFLATMLNDVKSKGISNESFFYCNFAHHKETKWWKFNSFICLFSKTTVEKRRIYSHLKYISWQQQKFREIITLHFITLYDVFTKYFSSESKFHVFQQWFLKKRQINELNFHHFVSLWCAKLQ